VAGSVGPQGVLVVVVGQVAVDHPAGMATAVAAAGAQVLMAVLAGDGCAPLSRSTSCVGMRFNFGTSQLHTLHSLGVLHTLG
jgi:hypothetical protein